MHIPLSRVQGLATGQRRHAIDKQILGRVASLLKGLCQTSLGLLLNSNKLLLASLSNKVDLGSLSTTDGKELGELGLVDDAELGVAAADVALPVRVVGDVASGERNGVVVLERVVGAGGRVAEVRVQRNTVRSLGVDG